MADSNEYKAASPAVSDSNASLSSGPEDSPLIMPDPSAVPRPDLQSLFGPYKQDFAVPAEGEEARSRGKLNYTQVAAPSLAHEDVAGGPADPVDPA